MTTSHGDSGHHDSGPPGSLGSHSGDLSTEDAAGSGLESPLVETGAQGHSPNEPNAAVRQLESILQNLTTYARPALREIAARAAEVAAKAAEAAGPVAHRAAGLTEDVGDRLAAKGRELASDLRSDVTAKSDAPVDRADTWRGPGSAGD